MNRLEAYVEPYCPFCRTENTVTLFAPRTSMYDTLYRCGLCYKVFDQKERHLQNEKNRQRRKTELTAPTEEKTPPTKKTWLFVGGCTSVFLLIMAIYFS